MDEPNFGSDRPRTSRSGQRSYWRRSDMRFGGLLLGMGLGGLILAAPAVLRSAGRKTESTTGRTAVEFPHFICSSTTVPSVAVMREKLVQVQIAMPPATSRATRPSSMKTRPMIRSACFGFCA